MDARLFHGISEFENNLRAKGYQQLEPFFVLREGEIYDERTGGVVKLDRNRLEEIAEVQNRRIATTGDATPIIIGHTKRGKDEKDQPKLTGWATRFMVAPFLNTNTFGLQAVPWSKHENIKNFDEYPRRSAELWTNPDLIDPISILGANTPRLDLGLHRLQRRDDSATPVADHGFHPRVPLILEMCNMPPPDTTTDAPATPKNKDAAAGAEGNPEIAQLKAQVADMMGMMELLRPLIEEIKASQAGPPGAGGPPGMGAPPGGPPGMGAPPGGPPGGMPPGPPDQPQQFNMAGGPAGGNNTMMPTHLQRGWYYDPVYGYVPVPANGQQQPLQLQQQYQPQQYQHQHAADPRDAELAKMRGELASMQLSMITNSVNGLLDTLDAEIVIDRKRDFERLVRLSRADLDAEVAFMRQTRAKKDQPLPGEAVPLHMQADGATGPRAGAAGPMQLSLQQAMEGGYGMGGDPRLVKGQPPQVSLYDQLTEAVRNRGKGEDAMVAYRRVMGGNVDPATGKTITPTRG